MALKRDLVSGQCTLKNEPLQLSPSLSVLPSSMFILIQLFREVLEGVLNILEILS